MKQLPILVWKGCPCVRASLYSLCVPSAFSGRAVSDMNTTYIPQGVLAAITLIGCGAGDGGAMAGAWCELGLLLCLGASTTLLGAGSIPKLLEQKP